MDLRIAMTPGEDGAPDSDESRNEVEVDGDALGVVEWSKHQQPPWLRAAAPGALAPTCTADNLLDVWYETENTRMPVPNGYRPGPNGSTELGLFGAQGPP